MNNLMEYIARNYHGIDENEIINSNEFACMIEDIYNMGFDEGNSEGYDEGYNDCLDDNFIED